MIMHPIIKELLSFCGDKTRLIDSDAIKSNRLYRMVLSDVMEPLFEEKSTVGDEKVSTNLIKIGVLYDSIYNRLHTGQWNTVEATDRECFTVLSYARILYTLLVTKNLKQAIKDGIYLADLGLMLGSIIRVDDKDVGNDLLTETATRLTAHLADENIDAPPFKRMKFDVNLEDVGVSEKIDVPILDCPSLELFGNQCYDLKQPTLLRGIIKAWPAMERWHDPNYLLSIASERTVPIEFGSQYSNDDWSQKLMKFREFVEQNICGGSSSGVNRAAYLAQHDLFDQVPALRRDITVPDYIGRTDANPRIKAWLGPKGTVSPLHTDPCHNLLCQVFGSKTIILARPEDTDKLYPHEHFILSNTSQVDARCPDLERFPLVRQVRFQRLTLHRGEVLYLPPQWWHYVESLSPSFSVSFWFE
uniref:JmjC domain-containing protein n=1 Tax=Anopheles atroparvus TaxID=41427 RepID=A0A182IQY3_ANOAO